MSQHGPRTAAHLLDQVIDHDDEGGTLANATGDELRDALRVAADRLRILAGRPPRSVWLVGARRLTAEVWHCVQLGQLNSRSQAADACLNMRDLIDKDWTPDVEEERGLPRGNPLILRGFPS